MKSYTYKILAAMLTLTAFTGCDRELETEGLTKKITYYPVFEMEGEEEIVVPYNSNFTDPGVVATEKGAEIPVETSITGTYFKGGVPSLDTKVPDIYHVVYSATNVDGYSGSVTRTVTVLPPTGDLVNSLEGVYTMTVARTPAGGPATADYTDREFGYISKVGPNTYQISDAIGGYYEFGREYGPEYAAIGGTITGSGGSFAAGSKAVVGGFGGDATISNVSVDPSGKTVSFKATWAPYVFDVTFKQVQP